MQLGVKIKWPNDLYLDGLKIGGILCTSTYKSKKFNVSAGKHSYSSDIHNSIHFVLGFFITIVICKPFLSSHPVMVHS